MTLQKKNEQGLLYLLLTISTQGRHSRKAVKKKLGVEKYQHD